MADVRNTSLSDIPVEVLGYILDFLSMEDKYRASITCKQINLAFHYSSSWETQILRSMPHYEKEFRKSSYDFPGNSKTMLFKYGHYIKNLTIDIQPISSYLITEEFNNIFILLSQRCRLVQLTLNIDVRRLYFGKNDPNEQTVVDVLVSFVKQLNSTRLKKVIINSWPIYIKSEDECVCCALIKRPNPARLNTLMWATPPCVEDISSDHIIKLMQCFQLLTEIGVYASELSIQLIDHLNYSHKTNLRRLGICVNSVRCIPEIPPIHWLQLSKTHKDISVDCEIRCHVGIDLIMKMLTTDCPLSKIVLLEKCRCDNDLLQYLSQYRLALKIIIIYGDIADCDLSLIQLSLYCINLHSIKIGNQKKKNIYEGSISYKTIENMAEIRGRKWKAFDFIDKLISYVDVTALDRGASYDTIVARDGTGFYFKNVHRFHCEPEGEERDRRRNALIRNISKSIGPEIGCSSVIT